MRERFDFSSISKIILDNRKNEWFSQAEYYYTLFRYAFTQSDFAIAMPDQANGNKIVNGDRNVPKDIATICGTPNGKKGLVESVTEILMDVSDTAYIKEQIDLLLWQDNTISLAQKKELSKLKDSLAEFIAECLLLGMTRCFISRKKKQQSASNKSNIILTDYLLDYHFPSVNKVFLGREREIEEIHRRLNNDFYLFIAGIGGIGKSELAKQYAKHYEKEYSNIICIRYNENLRRTLCELSFIDDTPDMNEQVKFDMHYRFFKCLGQDTLVVLDNFNNVPENDELFHDFLALSFRLLVTTRNMTDEAPYYLLEEIESMDALTNIFYAYASKSKSKPKVVEDIIEEVYRHTLAVEMASKTMTASNLLPEELLSALRLEGIQLSNPNKIKVTKDCRTKKDRLYGHIQTLFQLQQLSDNHQYTLRHMLLMPEKGIPKGLFQHWMGTNDYNNVNELIEYGWIREDIEMNYIFMHPFLHEVISTFFVLTFGNCSKIIQSVFLECFAYERDIVYYQDVINTIESICANFNFDDSEDSYLFMGSAMAFLDKYGCFDVIEKILTIMEIKIPLNKEHKKQMGIYCLYKGNLFFQHNNFKKAEEYWWQAVEILNPISNKTAGLAANLHSNLSQVATLSQDSKTGLIEAKKAIDIRNEYHLPFTRDSIVLSMNYALALFSDNRRGQAKEIALSLAETVENFANFGTTQADIYSFLGLFYMEENPKKSKDYFKRAHRLFAAHLPADDKKILELELMMKLTEYRPLQSDRFSWLSEFSSDMK